MVPLALNDWMIDRYAVNLTAVEARVAEQRLPLTAERHTRVRAQGGRVDTSTRRIQSAMRHIEERALGRIHRLPPLHRPMTRRDVTRIIAEAMRRIQDATRVTDR